MKNKKRLIIALFLIVTIASAVSSYILFRNGIKNPFSEVCLNNISDVAIDEAGNSYIINEGGYEIIRLNLRGEIDLIIKGNSTDGNGFYHTTSVTTDRNGNIYILNSIPSNKGISWIGEENVVVFDSNGNYIKTVCRFYHETPVLKPSIICLNNFNGSVYTISARQSALLINNVNNGDVELFPFMYADRYINSAKFDAKNDIVYATTYDGRILELLYDKYTELYTTAHGTTDSGVYTDIDIDSTGNIYICDSIQRKILTLKNGCLQDYCTPTSAVYSFDINNAVLINGIYSVSVYKDDVLTTYSNVAINKIYSLRYILFYLLILIFFIAIIYPLLTAIKYFKTSVTAKAKTITAISFIVSIIIVAFTTILSGEFTSMQSDSILHESAQYAQIVNSLIDGDEFVNLKSSTDYYSKTYVDIKEKVENVILDNGKLPGQYYLMMYTLDENSNLFVRYSLEERYGCNYPYIWSSGEGEKSIYETGKTVLINEANDSNGTYLCAYSPITNSKNNIVGVIEVGTNLLIFRESVNRRVTLAAISIIALSIVFVLIILEFVEFIEAGKGIELSEIKKHTKKPPLKIYRVSIFLVYFITSLTVPFLSIYSVELAQTYSRLWNIPPEVLAAIPISAEVLFGALFSVAGGTIIQRIKHRKAALLGCILFTFGLAVRFFYPDLIVLTIGNSIQGAGWGIILLVITSFFSTETDAQLQEEGFSFYNIAMRNGGNSGIVLGGFLQTISSYNTILIITTILSVSVLLFVYYFVFDRITDTAEECEDKFNVSSTGIKKYIRFIFKPRVLIYFLFIIIPVVAASYYLNFLYPILADSVGISENFIGYSFLLNGLIVICFGNIIVNFMSRYFSKKINLMLASLIYLLAFVIVGQSCTINMLLISLVLIAISDSFGYVAQSTIFSELKEVDEFGHENALGVYSLFENLAQSAGSFIFGYILTVGIKSGLTMYGILIGACGIIFVIFFTLLSRKRSLNKNEN